MQAVFLDFATMGPGLDTTALATIFPDIKLFEVTTGSEIAERIHDAEFLLHQLPTLRRTSAGFALTAPRAAT
jgi:hypothetical protein